MQQLFTCLNQPKLVFPSGQDGLLAGIFHMVRLAAKKNNLAWLRDQLKPSKITDLCLYSTD